MLKISHLLSKLFCGSLISLSIGLPAVAAAEVETYANHVAIGPYIDELVSEHQLSREDLVRWFSAAEKKQSILDAIARPAEKSKPWKDYRKIFVTESRTAKGLDFWRENEDALNKAEATYGVPPEVVVAIIGVETRYGSNTGRYRVIDALSTLAFDYPKRSKFFKKELTHFLLLAREQGQNPMDLKGSYAGAMGYGQFMPSSYREYAVDFDGDNLADIWLNPTDAIGSVANYFKRHGWKTGEPVVTRARVSADYDPAIMKAPLKPAITLATLDAKGIRAVEKNYATDQLAAPFRLEGERGAEFWLGLQNFYVITRYNHSRMYALSVHQLSQALKQQYRAAQK